MCVFQTGFQYLLGLTYIYQEGYSYKERFVILRDYKVTEDGCEIDTAGEEVSWEGLDNCLTSTRGGLSRSSGTGPWRSTRRPASALSSPGGRRESSSL